MSVDLSSPPLIPVVALHSEAIRFDALLYKRDDPFWACHSMTGNVAFSRVPTFAVVGAQEIDRIEPVPVSRFTNVRVMN